MTQYKKGLAQFLLAEANAEEEKARVEREALLGWSPPANVRRYRERMANRHELRADQFRKASRKIRELEKVAVTL